MKPLTLTTALRTHGHTAALKSGQVPVRGATLSFIEVEPQILAFRRMVRDLAYDVCELAPTTYIIAKAYGAPFTAIPIFFERRFHHAGLLVRDDAGIGREGSPQAGWKAKERKEVDSYRELFPDPDSLGAEWFRRTGIYPMHSTLVIKDEILGANPWLAKALFEAFQESKQLYLERLHDGAADSGPERRHLKQMKVVGDDPLPYGLEVNRRSIATLIIYAFQQWR